MMGLAIMTDLEITTGPEIMGGEITMWREITMAPEIMMDGEIIMMLRSQQTTAMGHGMDAPQTGPYRAASVSPTKAPSVEGRTRGTAARPGTRYRAANVSRTLDRVSKKGAFAPVLAKQQLRQLGDIANSESPAPARAGKARAELPMCPGRQTDPAQQNLNEN
jgi:hypothetical protein